MNAEQRRLERILNDEEYGPKLVRLNRAQEREILDLISANRGREARARINEYDEARRGSGNITPEDTYTNLLNRLARKASRIGRAQPPTYGRNGQERRTVSTDKYAKRVRERGITRAEILDQLEMSDDDWLENAADGDFFFAYHE